MEAHATQIELVHREQQEQRANRKCRRLARDVREAVRSSEQPPKARACRVSMLLDRVRAVRVELLELADELDSSAEQPPARIALVRQLLRDGGGPLYYDRVPESELHELLARARVGGLT
jgi:hypothetical protein